MARKWEDDLDRLKQVLAIHGIGTQPGASGMPNEVFMDRVAEIVAASTPWIVARMDNWTIVAASEAVEHLFGYKVRGQLAGQHINTLVPEALRSRHSEHLKGFAGSPETRPMGKGLGALKGRKRDGTEFPVAISLRATMIPGVDAECVLATILDLSQRSE